MPKWFNLDESGVGETREVETESGKLVLVGRDETDVDGELVDVDEILSELDLQDVDSEDVIVIRKKVEIEQDGAL